ncbi:MAG TPA: carotenoid biosynthesis protein [Kineosporiaceae bacterium]|nr:carotenoid biosynthesis protein [Kineosporiaceae bacterium]
MAVAAQVTYPLLGGGALRAATVIAVIAFTTAVTAHAAAWFGSRAALAVLTGAAGLGLAAEAVGVATGWPFGRYAYTDTLGPRVLGVPLVVPLAWTMMAYPALVAARRLVPGVGWSGLRRAATVALVGGVTLAAWDLFLDPQMVAAGHWVWADPSPSLPGVPTVPLGNTAGWLLVGIVMTALLDRLLDRRAAIPVAAELLPAALLAWTWLGSMLANLAFFGHPQVAALGGVTTALVVVPYLVGVGRAIRGERSLRRTQEKTQEKTQQKTRQTAQESTRRPTGVDR